MPSTFHRGDHAARNFASGIPCGVYHHSPRGRRLGYGTLLSQRLVRGRRAFITLLEHDRLGDLLRRMGSSRNRAFLIDRPPYPFRTPPPHQSRGALVRDRVPIDGRSGDTGSWRVGWGREERPGDSTDTTCAYGCISPTVLRQVPMCLRLYSPNCTPTRNPTYTLLSATLVLQTYTCPLRLLPCLPTPLCPPATPNAPESPLHTYS